MAQTSPGGATAEAIRIELHRQRRTGRDLAAAVGWTPATCSRRLNGLGVINVDELYACARFLGLTVDELLDLAERELELVA